MQSKRIIIRLPEELIAAIDEAAGEYFETRSEFIRMAILMRLKRQSLVDQPSKEDQLAKILSSLSE